MINRVKTGPEGDREPEGPGAYFYLSSRSGSWCVSTVMARHIEACLDAEPRPSWIRFVDIAGSSIRVRARDIEYLNQSTPEQRAFDRAFCRSIRQEKKADRNWEEDE
jgi:hypothetical protein